MPRISTSKWGRFSLRWLFGAITLVCLLLAWLLHAVHSQNRRQAFAADLTSRRCLLKTEYSEPTNAYSAATWLCFLDSSYGTHVVELFARSTLSADDIEGMELFPHLRDLHLGQLSSPRSALRRLGPLDGLERLSLNKTEIPPGGLEEIGRLAHLEELNLNGTAIPPGELRFVARLPRLKRLALRNTTIPSGELRHISSSQSLRGLSLAGAKVNLDDLALIGCPNLESLNLTGLPVTNDSLRHIAGIKRLTRLAIDGGALTDDGLVFLEDCAKLEHLQIAHFQITDAAIVHLQLRLPSLEVMFEPSDWSKPLRPNASGLTAMKGFQTSGPFVTDETLRWLEGAHNLVSLSLFGARITDDGMRHVAKLANLKSLDIRYTAVGDEGLASIAGLPLNSLLVGGLKGELAGPGFEHYSGMEMITDEGLGRISEIKTLSSRLSIASRHITDEGLLAIAKLSNLERLWLTAPQIRGHGFEFVESLGRLNTLELRQTPFTRDVARHLAKAPDLRELDIYSVQIPRGALAELTASATIEKLDLWGTTFEEDPLSEISAIKSLRSIALYTEACDIEDGKNLLAARPDCQVYVIHEGKYVEVK